MKTLINLTAHSIYEVTTGTTIPASGIVARVKQTTTKVKTIGNMPVYSSVFGEVEGLPEPQNNTVYIVSSLVLNATKRKDVVAPGNLQRNEHGQPIGCVGFRVNA